MLFSDNELICLHLNKPVLIKKTIVKINTEVVAILASVLASKIANLFNQELLLIWINVMETS